MRRPLRAHRRPVPRRIDVTARDAPFPRCTILARDLARLHAPRGARSRKCLLLSRKPSLISEIAFPGGGAVNKSGLIDAVSKTTSLAKRDAEEAVNALVHVVSNEVRSGRRVVVAGFGSFNPTHRGARMGRNPRTGAPVSISASRGVRFAASGMLKDILNGKAAPPALKVSRRRRRSRPRQRRKKRRRRGRVRRSQRRRPRPGQRRSRHQGHQELDPEGGHKHRRPGIEKGRRARPGQKDDARPGEESSKAIGQKGRRTSSGEESNKAIGQEGR